MNAEWRERCLAAVRVRPEPACLKRCGCGAQYDLAGWGRLRYCGVVEVEVGEFSELRNCSACGSTIAVRVDVLRGGT